MKGMQIFLDHIDGREAAALVDGRLADLLWTAMLCAGHDFVQK